MHGEELSTEARIDFIHAQTTIAATPLVPEVRLRLAAEAIELWERIEDSSGESDTPPPFWAFPWAGGQALARHVLDHDELVAGRRVLDLASGSGLVAIAAALAGAEEVVAVDIDRFAVAAIGMNAAINEVAVAASVADVLHGDGLGAEVVLAGDVFYERAMAARMLPMLARARARGALVLVGDPGRRYLPPGRFESLAEYDVPVVAALEDMTIKRTTVWRMSADRD
ncbi:putative nicotinamide N-methyase [Actinoalloteichus hoggarensis]|uniref:class I SAM-dependent methyltransferase n=1 Tax=Actinoalloteichus hoggarensis TaxID=1470176 RepID=UPI0017910B68|nr:50S ribosomal protein L11 methyltransferase [Actinoalloteichus hoggarensis]MBB5919013.1 putative nicotinamide N-methyase [Actinoalloteichus hoggarensis]